ncbi:MAG: DUF6090 family protein [bacterium]|nr:DUF6090 family protein [bacterium]
MLRFFKKLRSQNLSKGSIRKYVLYILGELLLIVTGIVIAVQINNMNNNRKLLDSEKLYLERLLTDVKNDFERFHFLDSMYNLSLKDCSEILEELKAGSPKEEKLKIISYGFLNFYSMNPHSTTYEEMVNTGRLYTTKNKDLRTSIIRYYNNVERENNYLENANMRVKKYMDHESMNDYWLLKRRLRSNLKILDSEFPWLSKNTSKEWRSLETMTYVYQTSEKKNKLRMSNLKGSAEQLISLLEKELK